MNSLRFWKKSIEITFKKLCQQRLLLAGLALLCFLLPLSIGIAAESAFSQNISFSGIQLAITALEDDPVPQQLEQVLSSMQDIQQYCRVEAMDYSDAVEALKQGDVTAVLVLPENFVNGIMDGSNPDVELIVSGDRPLEALLTFWVGRSASDLLTAVQSGIYTVLELYHENPVDNLEFQEVVLRVNMRYINWTLNRQGMYRIQQIQVTDQLPLRMHYSLSLFIWLVLALTPMFTGIYSAKWVASKRRFRAVGIGSGSFYGASLVVCWIADGLLIGVFQLVLGAGIGWAVLSGLICGLFCAVFGSFCCLITHDTGSCGVVSFIGSLALLALSGGILPPVLMPPFLQKWIWLSPVTWLRNMMAAAFGYEPKPFQIVAVVISALLLAGFGAILYAHRGNKEEAVL